MWHDMQPVAQELRCIGRVEGEGQGLTLDARSERLAKDVDCSARTFRSLAVYRYPENNLSGEATAFKFDESGWIKPEPGAFDETVVEAACMKPESLAG